MEFFTFFAFMILIILLISLHIFHESKIKHKSPLSLPIVGHLHIVIKKPLYRTLAKLSDKYGPVMFLRYGFRKVLIISSSSAVEECLSKNDIIFANRPSLIVGHHLGYNHTSIVWASYGDHWRNLRRVIALEIFSSRRLQLFSNARSGEIRSLVLQLAGNCDGKSFHEVNLGTTFFELTLNIIMLMIAGKRFCGENVVDIDEAKRFQSIVVESFELIGAPNLADFLPFLGWLDVQGLKKRMVKVSKERDIFMQNLLDERRNTKYVTTKDGEENNTLIDVLLSHQDADPEYYTDNIIKGMITTLLTAGTDTSTATMEWGMSLLLNHPEFLKKARDEMDVVVGRDRLIQESDIQDLPYLNNIISETLRLYPPGPVVIHESSKDCTVGGLHVPSGTMLQMNFWAVHRDPNEWVEPLTFNPERFEGAEGEKEGYKWIPFGSGRRRCPGEGLAMRMVGLTLGTLIQCFEWERVGVEMVDMTEGTGLTLPRAKPLVAMCKPRPFLKQITLS